MGKPISVDLRSRLCEAVREGLSCRQAASRFKISASSAIRWMSQLNTGGMLCPRPQGGESTLRPDRGRAAFILARVAETPDTTLTELQPLLSAHGLDVGIGTLWRFFDCRQTTLINPLTPPSRRGDVAAAREAWFEAQINLDPAKLIFIDENVTNTKMTGCAAVPLALVIRLPSPPVSG